MYCVFSYIHARQSTTGYMVYLVIFMLDKVRRDIIIMAYLVTIMHCTDRVYGHDHYLRHGLYYLTREASDALDTTHYPRLGERRSGSHLH